MLSPCRECGQPCSTRACYRCSVSDDPQVLTLRARVATLETELSVARVSLTNLEAELAIAFLAVRGHLAALNPALKTGALCVECGPQERVDADGCCLTCGNGACGAWLDANAGSGTDG